MITAFSLLVLTEQPRLTRLFLKKSRISLPCPVQSRSENALVKSKSPVRSFVRGRLLFSNSEQGLGGTLGLHLSVDTARSDDRGTLQLEEQIAQDAWMEHAQPQGWERVIQPDLVEPG